MKIAKRLFLMSLTLLVFLFAVPVPAAAVDAPGGTISNFVYVTGYTAGQFADVDESKWYGEGGQQVIGNACRLGLMKGTAGGFSPAGTVTLAEAVTMAARLNNLYYGSPVTFEQGTPWYKVYTDYAIEQGIIRFEDFEDLSAEKPLRGAGVYADYTRAATRAEMAYIFANALPDTEFSSINDVDAIADVDEKTPYADSIILLYRAGVLTGDQAGFFHPDAPIDRASAAAVITRAALPDMRKTFVIKEHGGVPKWSHVYTSRMWVETTQELETIYTAAVLNRIDSFEVRTTKAVLDGFYDGGVLYDYNVGKLRYEYGGSDDSLLRITIFYTLFGEVEALALTADAADRASEQALRYHSQIEALTSSILADGMSTREKCKAIHDYMVQAFEYDLAFQDASYSFAGLLDNHKAVCQGYMELFYLVAARAGVDCEMVTGLADGSGTGTYEPHGWNRVYLDGAWYHIDVTFDDPVGGDGTVSYDYFLITGDEIAKNHSW